VDKEEEEDWFPEENIKPVLSLHELCVIRMARNFYSNDAVTIAAKEADNLMFPHDRNPFGPFFWKHFSLERNINDFLTEGAKKKFQELAEKGEKSLEKSEFQLQLGSVTFTCNLFLSWDGLVIGHAKDYDIPHYTRGYHFQFDPRDLI
jgi:hypothetical protein